MDMEQLLGKLKRCRKPSRKLDLECWWWGKATHSGYPMDESYRKQNLKMNDAPCYTANINDAAKLIPPGLFMALNTTGWAAVNNADGTHVAQATHKSATIALCIAALKARAAQGPCQVNKTIPSTPGA